MLDSHTAKIHEPACTIACAPGRHASSKHVSLLSILRGATADALDNVSVGSAADAIARSQALMGSHLPRWERMLCYVVIPVTLLLSVVGVGSSVAALVRQVRQR